VLPKHRKKSARQRQGSLVSERNLQEAPALLVEPPVNAEDIHPVLQFEGVDEEASMQLPVFGQLNVL